MTSCTSQGQFSTCIAGHLANKKPFEATSSSPLSSHLIFILRSSSGHKGARRWWGLKWRRPPCGCIRSLWNGLIIAMSCEGCRDSVSQVICNIWPCWLAMKFSLKWSEYYAWVKYFKYRVCDLRRTCCSYLYAGKKSSAGCYLCEMNIFIILYASSKCTTNLVWDYNFSFTMQVRFLLLLTEINITCWLITYNLIILSL